MDDEILILFALKSVEVWFAALRAVLPTLSLGF